MHVEVIVGPDEEPLRRRDRAAPAARALPGVDPQARQGPRPLQEADGRPRPVRRLPHRDRCPASRAPASSSSTRSRAASIPKGFIPAVEKGIAEAMQHGTLAGYPVKDLHGAPLRRPAPPRGLIGDRVQGRRLDGLQAGDGAGRPGAARADHAAHRRVPEDVGRRRRRRSQLAARTAAGRGAEGLGDRDQGRGADGRGARLRARPARDHRRPRRLHDGVRAPRGDPRRTSPSR